MKNSTYTKQKNNFKNNNSCILAICLMLLLGVQSIAQKSNTGYRLGMGVGTHLSGNSHGAMYSLSVSLYDGKNHFSIGPCLQKRKEEICGASFRYARILSGQENFLADGSINKADNECHRVQLFTFVQAQYLKGAALSYKAVKMEEAAAKQNDYKTDYSKYQLSTAELFAGFGLNTKINNKLVWSTSIGFGTYYHLDYVNGLYNERMAPVLMLGTALRLNYFRN
ncbi:MAG: hypothetical protein K0S53_2921 [Bacteroidetes bacterium]|jgi:hypothetical protein|nr:hypothetical protein [Bacteroidota bacterium]MDF2450720.1 hypothetical protein [Bacteroidota bacterium]